ncbi:MAG: acyl-CoA dehydrogenase family protein [Acidimicrobiales bacterium]
MDFQLTPDQADIRDGIRKLCAGRFPIDKLRALEGVGFDAVMWSELSDTGVFALRRPEAEGGAGLGMADAALVFEELGRGLVPGPTVCTHLASGLGLGSVVGGIERTSGPFVIEHLAHLTDLVIIDDAGLWRVDPSELDAAPGEPIDPLTPVSVVTSLPGGVSIGDAAAAKRWRVAGAVLVAAQLAGIASALVDLTVAYTKERVQFNRPVGSFQALKHTMADMLTKAELARVQVYAAAVHLDDPSLPDLERSVSAAKVVAGHAALANGAASIQCHGGMGYTWEVDSHLYLKRAWVLDASFGSGDDHALAVAGHLHEE